MNTLILYLRQTLKIGWASDIEVVAENLRAKNVELNRVRRFSMDNEMTERRNQIVKAMTDVEFYPEIMEEGVSIAEYEKIPLTSIMALGTAFEPLVGAFQNVLYEGGSTKTRLCRVTTLNGGKLAKFKDGSGFMGSVLTENNAVGGGRQG